MPRPPGAASCAGSGARPRPPVLARDRPAPARKRPSLARDPHDLAPKPANSGVGAFLPRARSRTPRPQGSGPCAQASEPCARGEKACAQRSGPCAQASEPCVRKAKSPARKPKRLARSPASLALKEKSLATGARLPRAQGKKAPTPKLRGLRATPGALRASLRACRTGRKGSRPVPASPDPERNCCDSHPGGRRPYGCHGWPTVDQPWLVRNVQAVADVRDLHALQIRQAPGKDYTCSSAEPG